MRPTLLIVIALSALAAACHERRQDPPRDDDAIRARSESAHAALDAQKPASDH